MLKRTNRSVYLLRKISIFLSIISIITLSLTACGQGQATNNDQVQATTSFVVSDSAATSTGAVPSDTSLASLHTITDKDLIIATTTSVNDSGLLEYLTPVFKEDTGINLKVISQGTGQAIKTGEAGDADVLLIHAKASEEKFVSEGYGLERIELAYNYFVIVGPKLDPAGILSQKYSAAEAFKKIFDSKSTFVSRGDDSGTHKKELTIWKANNLTPQGAWYVSAGKGMGAVLSMADEKSSYTLTDKATYLSMKDKLDLQIVVDESKDLLNQYTIIQVNPDKHEGINKAGADKFVQWMTSEKALKMIDEFGKDKYGEGLFKVNYKK